MSTASTAEIPIRRTVGLSAAVRMGTFPFTAIATFVTTALVIGYAGPTSYAALSVVITLSQLVPYADLGVGAGVINAVSSAGVGDDSGRRAVASAIRVLCISALVLALLGLLVAATVGWPTVLNLSDADLAGLPGAILGITTLIAVMVPLGIGQRVLTALLLNPTAVAIAAIGPILGLIGTVAIVLMEWPAVMLAFPPVVGATISALVATALALTRLEFRLSDVLRVRRFRYPGLLGIGLWYLLLSVASALTYQSGRVILARTSTLETVADFAITMQLYVPIWSFFAAAGTALWPIFARYRAARTSSSLLLRRMTLGFGGAGVLCAVLLITLGPWLTSLISRGEIRPSVAVFGACALLIVIQSIQLVQGVSLTSLTGIRFQAIWAIPLAVMVIPTTWVLTPSTGAAAPFIAAAIGVFAFQVVPNFVRIFRQGAAPSEPN